MISFFNKRKTNQPYATVRQSVAGFTLIELLVTLTLVVMATGLVMIRYVSFNSSVLLNSLAYEVAFDLREAQSLAVSIRGNDTNFREEYGIFFDMTTPNQYILFLDTNQSLARGDDQDRTGDRLIEYDPDEGEAVGEPFIIDPRFRIVDLCGRQSGGGTKICYTDDEGLLPGQITIAFARPDFDAIMYGEGIGPLMEAEIVVGPGDDAGNEIRRSIFVSGNGQIGVRASMPKSDENE